MVTTFPLVLHGNFPETKNNSVEKNKRAVARGEKKVANTYIKSFKIKHFGKCFLSTSTPITLAI